MKNKADQLLCHVIQCVHINIFIGTCSNGQTVVVSTGFRATTYRIWKTDLVANWKAIVENLHTLNIYKGQPMTTEVLTRFLCILQTLLTHSQYGA